MSGDDAKRADKLRIEDTQKAGQHDEVWAVPVQRSLERSVPVAPIWITVERHDQGRDLGSSRSLQGAATGPVRSHCDDLTAEIGRVDERLQGGAGPRCQHDEANGLRHVHAPYPLHWVGRGTPRSRPMTKLAG